MLGPLGSESNDDLGNDPKELCNLAEDVAKLLTARFGKQFCMKNKGGFILILVNEEKNGFHVISNYTPSTCPHCLDVLHSTILPLHEQLDKMKDDLRDIN